MIKDKTCDKRMRAGRKALIMYQPFFGVQLLRLHLEEDYNVETMQTNGVYLKYNPKFVDTLSDRELETVQAHEVMHVTNAHHLRRKNRDADLWNAAADYAVNGILNQAGFTPLSGWYLDPKYFGMSTEAIYAKLPPPPKKGGGGSGAGQGGNQGGKPSCGPGEVVDHPSCKKGQAAISLAAADHRAQLAQALAIGKKAGNMPGSLIDLIEGLLHPKVDWVDQCRQFVELMARNDYNFSRPNRRFMQTGFILPSLYNQEIALLAINQDTSASVDKEMCRRFASELSAILQYVDVGRILLMQSDTKIQLVKELGKGDLPLKMEFHGRGGTDFTPPFVELEKMGEVPSALIFFSDMECSSYPPAPEYPVLWARCGSDRSIPPFGDIIQVE
jgi:predicted metal-dependent peptidase